MQQDEVKVWDIFVRVFHWSLVFLFVVVYLTGEEESRLHIVSGYAIAALIILRVIWGFISGKYARFDNFIVSPGKVVEYVKSLPKNPRHYLGHNPAGGYMILALLFMLTLTTYTGLKLYATEGKGPLAANINVSLISEAIADDDRDEDQDEHGYGEQHEEGNNEDYWEELHELSANLTVLLIFLHIAGVVVSGRMHKENLVKVMITGRKTTK